MTNKLNTIEDLKAAYGDLFDIQLELEDAYKQLAREKMEQNMESNKRAGRASDSPIAARYIDYKLDDVAFNMCKLVEDAVKGKAGVKPKYHFVLTELAKIYEGDEEDLYKIMAVTALGVMMNSAFQSEMRLSNMSHAIGLEIQQEAHVEAYIRSNKSNEKSITRGIGERIDRKYKVFYAMRRMQHDGYNWTEWSVDEMTALGCKMIELTMAATGYFEECHDTTVKGSSVLEIRPKASLLEAWSKSEDNTLAKAYRLIPTVIPPQPWEDYYTGGYYGSLAASCTLLRINETYGENAFSKKYMERLNQLELTGVRDAVNALQATPWKINSRVLEVINSILEQGGGHADIPCTEPLPKLPDLVGEYSEEELKEHKKAKAERYRMEGRRGSKALRALAHVAVAKDFSNYDKIYFPWNMDFRGRCYPIATFGPQGTDLDKALLSFADAPPVQSEEDIDWLAVHGANLAGEDKIPFADRIAWVKTNEQHIIAAAADPMGTISWWGNLDCPLQFIAFCFDWADMLTYKEEQGTVKGWVTGICVAFDGTCSGIQHFSAILRDSIGGAAVNLIPSDRPQDIYRRVADKVVERLQKDATNGTMDEDCENDKGTYVKYGTKYLAQEWLNYGITRSTTKRCVMTLAYGATEYGFRDQIMEDTIVPHNIKNPGVTTWINPAQSARYMAKLIWDAVGVVVIKAVEGMKWLQDTSKLVCKGGHTVTWTTPMGLPVQQAYMDTKSDVIRMRFGGEFKRIYTFKLTGNINKRRQASGIAPNFIHSMDAAHLQLTINMCHARGINHFSMIHDSYGAPVSQAGLIFKTTREAFIKMYTENDVLENFKNDMEVYIERDEVVPAIPAKGDLDINVVKDSLYTFH